MIRIIAALLIFIPTSSFALSFPHVDVENPISIEISPANPKPGEAVTITARSFIIDLDRATLAWRVNGSVVKGGIGETSVRSVMEGLGEPLIVQLVTESFDKNLYENTFRLYPARVAIVWEADTYTPAFFKGRALPSPGASITAFALPEFAAQKPIAPNALFYEWSLDGKILPDGRGAGKSAVTFTMPEFPGTYQLRVVVQTTQGDIESSVTVPLVSQYPVLSLYKDTPLLGSTRTSSLLWNPYINDVEATVALIPYYAAIEGVRDQKLSYTWRFDGKTFQHDLSDPNRVTLLLGDGRARIRTTASIQHRDHLLQTAERSWDLTTNRGDAPTNDPFVRQFNL